MGGTHHPTYVRAGPNRITFHALSAQLLSKYESWRTPADGRSPFHLSGRPHGKSDGQGRMVWTHQRTRVRGCRLGAWEGYGHDTQLNKCSNPILDLREIIGAAQIITLSLNYIGGSVYSLQHQSITISSRITHLQLSHRYDITAWDHFLRWTQSVCLFHWRPRSIPAYTYIQKHPITFSVREKNKHADTCL